jgi:ATP-binding protein involved in chromosome partitioning
MSKNVTKYTFACEFCGDRFDSKYPDEAREHAERCEAQGIETTPLPDGTPVIVTEWEKGARFDDDSRLIILLDEIHSHQVGSGKYQRGEGHQINYSLVRRSMGHESQSGRPLKEKRFWNVRPRDLWPHVPGQVNRTWGASHDNRMDGEILHRKAFHAGHYAAREEGTLQRAAELIEALAGRPLRRDWLTNLWALERLTAGRLFVLPPRPELDERFRDALDALARPVTRETIEAHMEQKRYGYRWIYDQISRGSNAYVSDDDFPRFATAAWAIACEMFDGNEARVRSFLSLQHDELPRILHERSEAWWNGEDVTLPVYLVTTAPGSGSGDALRAPQKKALLAVGDVQMEKHSSFRGYYADEPEWREGAIRVVSQPSTRHGQKHERYRPADALAGLFTYHPDMRSITVKKDTNRPPVPVICVASGKGGVGKTTVAAALAFALTRIGKVATVVDLDTQAPSLAPLLDLPPLQASDGRLRPHQIEGAGFWSPGQLFAQDQAIDMDEGTLEALLGFLAGTLDLDGNSVLIVDLPPGTPAVQHVVNAMWRPVGTVLVTTGSKVAHADLRRQAEVAREPIGIIENLTRIDLPGTHMGSIRLYDGADSEALADELGTAYLGSLPHQADPQELAGAPEMVALADEVVSAIEQTDAEDEREEVAATVTAQDLADELDDWESDD